MIRFIKRAVANDTLIRLDLWSGNTPRGSLATEVKSRIKKSIDFRNYATETKFCIVVTLLILLVIKHYSRYDPVAPSPVAGEYKAVLTTLYPRSSLAPGMNYLFQATLTLPFFTFILTAFGSGIIASAIPGGEIIAVLSLPLAFALALLFLFLEWYLPLYGLSRVSRKIKEKYPENNKARVFSIFVLIIIPLSFFSILGSIAIPSYNVEKQIIANRNAAFELVKSTDEYLEDLEFKKEYAPLMASRFMLVGLGKGELLVGYAPDWYGKPGTKGHLAVRPVSQPFFKADIINNRVSLTDEGSAYFTVIRSPRVLDDLKKFKGAINDITAEDGEITFTCGVESYAHYVIGGVEARVSKTLRYKIENGNIILTNDEALRYLEDRVLYRAVGESKESTALIKEIINTVGGSGLIATLHPEKKEVGISFPTSRGFYECLTFRVERENVTVVNNTCIN